MNQQDNQVQVPRSAREQTKKLKKIIIITFCIMLAFVLVYYIFSTFLYDMVSETLIGYFPFLRGVLNEEIKDEYQGNNFDEIPYFPDYDYNILKDPEYLGLDRKIYYFASSDQYGTQLELTEDNYDKQAVGVTLLCEMIDSIIMGDADAYNACFSDYYFEHKGIEPKYRFTMTQLYDIKITNFGQQSISDKKLGNYTEYHFVVQYSIHKNNNTFRNDVRSDGNTATYIIITDRNGELLIEDMFYNYHFAH